MAEPDSMREKASRRADIVAALCPVLLIGLFIGIAILAEGTPFRFFSVFSAFFVGISAGLPLGVLLHEFAHAFAFKAMGGTVLRIRLGHTALPTGPHLAFRLLGFRCEVYWFPIAGSVAGFLTNPRFYRRKMITVLSAGPLANLALVGASFGLYLALPASSLSSGFLGCALTNAYLSLFSIIPRRHSSTPGIEGNDAHNILKILRFSDEEIAAQCTAQRLLLDFEVGEFEPLSIEELIALRASQPDRFSVLFHLVNKLRAADDPRHIAYLGQLERFPGAPPSVVISFIDSFLTHRLTIGSAGMEQELDAYSLRLLELSENSLTCRGTRGSVLVDLGRIDEGVAMLEDVLAKTESTVDKCYSHIFLALAESARGNRETATHFARQAVSIAPNCLALPRIAHLLPPAESPSSGKTPTSRLATPGGCAK